MCWLICYGYSLEAPMLWVLNRNLTEVLLMSTHNICFCGEIKEYFPDTTILSGLHPGAMFIPSLVYIYPPFSVLAHSLVPSVVPPCFFWQDLGEY